MASAASERLELANLCRSKDWSKAIRVLDSILSQSCAIQDICNRAFCYSQLELHKHVIKDCDKALQLDPTLLQAYILKGHAFSALGRKEDAILVWQQGFEYATRQSADLKQMLELEDLLKIAKQDRSITFENHVMESSGSSMSVCESGPHNSSNSIDVQKINSKLIGKSESCSESNGLSEICSKPSDRSSVLNELADTVKRDKNYDVQSNGTYSVSDKLGDKAHLCSQLSKASEHKSAVICSKSSDSLETISNSNYLSEIHDVLNDETKKSKKFCVTRISETKSISVDFRLSRGIALVNEGKYPQALSIFDQILKEDPSYLEALIGRGTAYAFQRQLDDAMADFTKAVQSNPCACEAWKRRGQARAAVGKYVEAIEDLTKALEFEPNSADTLHERGIVNFKHKHFDAAIEDLSLCVKLDKDNKSAYTHLGLALSSVGEYARAKEAHMKSIQLDQNFVEAWAHLTQFYYDLANPTKALECLQQIQKIDERYVKAYFLRGVLFHGMGEHRNAIRGLSKGLRIDKSNIECLYLRASCYHAIGEYAEAVKDYDAALGLELDTMEKFVLQCLAFYQKEIALYTASKIHSEFCWFDIDGDIDPLFKEYWCKRLHPKNVCEKVFRQPPLRDSLKKGKLRKQDFAVTKQKATLLQVSDTIGKKIQYNCPGFLPNRRQHRMAGLAAIEIAQRVSKAWRSLQADWKYSNKSTSKYGKKARRKEKIIMLSQNRGGACCSTSSSSETSTSYGVTEDRSSGRSFMSWQDVYSIAVKWRQISEPCDPVVWVNRLSEEFNSGFGSHTPMILGQAKVVRYFPNYQRTLHVAKIVMKEKMRVYNKEDKIIDLSQDGKIQDIMLADSCSDLYRIIGEDFWLATWCNSTAVEGKQLEGTRITLVKLGECGFDFAITTPCTPSRWDDFDAEMTMAWEALCNAYCGETYGSTDLSELENVSNAILRMTFYWYNFMPLSRGSAAVGFVVLLGLFLAANMEFTGSIPQGLQVDWEAILDFDPDSFVDSVKSWLYPSLKVPPSGKVEYPDVASTFPTTGSVVAALSSYDD
ncbi:suppressor of RPS4-RLD 1 [Malania oleifera]|uniref:suppressor of RPS4-RLD 1 n=1 Tax=Malania oleifera TaxID=397392 RepID=UPI0025ADA63B|nr:suppressor of RPS4-RLD 1 [Malania oleifera]